MATRAPSSEARNAAPNRLRQVRPERGQLLDLPVEGGDPLAQAFRHPPAGLRRPELLDPQELADVVERQAGRLRPPDESDARSVRLPVEPVARGFHRRRGGAQGMITCVTSAPTTSGPSKSGPLQGFRPETGSSRMS
jgi:hypothetical protein